MGTSPPEEYFEHEVTHFTQRYSWDCGIACVAMLLEPAQRQHLLDNFDDICKRQGFGQLTWTIDLCYLLKEYGIPHSMYSSTLGVNEAHKKHSYYRDIIDQERGRVSQRFSQAAAGGLRLARGRLGMACIARHLRRGPALLLVDAGLLACAVCKHNQLRARLRRWFGGPFSGHFILLVGLRGGRLLFRDPGLRARTCAAPPRRLQRARTAPTDHDVILIHRGYTR